MYELAVALRYLLPRWRQLSASIISLLSLFVVALIVWLIVVFFSVTHGLEKSWTQKLLAITAPIRVLPTQAYYQSYYFLVDGISWRSDFAFKTLAEKRLAEQSDPYDPSLDEEWPDEGPQPHRRSDGTLIDPVKELFAAIQAVTPLGVVHADDFEIAPIDLEVTLFHSPAPSRRTGSLSSLSSEPRTSIAQSLYLTTLDLANPSLPHALMPLSSEDLHHLLSHREDRPEKAATMEEQKQLGSSSHRLQEPLSLSQQQQFFEELYPDREPLFLPKAFFDAGIRVGDQAQLSYRAPTATALQVMQIAGVIAGFYDPGILPVGAKFALAKRELVTTVRLAQELISEPQTNGIYIHLQDPDYADRVKESLTKELQERGIDSYFQIESYHDYPLAGDFLQQLKSERNLFTLLACIVILVACSNIISMLVILVNDKKQEIGILRAMGASSWSIAAIFGLCGVVMGSFGSALGITAALLTLSHLQEVIALLSALQGHELLHPLFFGETLPNQVSERALVFVIVVTSLVSLVAGLIPALKACWMRPAALLRND